MKKYFVFALIIGVLAVMPSFTQVVRAGGLTQSQIDAIVSLLRSFGAETNVVSNVQSVLSGGGSGGGSVPAWCHNFNTNLGIGKGGNEVANLITVLQKEGLLTEYSGHEPDYDERVASAVTGFQEKYADEVLTPNGLKYGTGFFGASTRAKMNKLYGCGAIKVEKPIPMPTPVPTPVPVPVPTPATCDISIMCVTGYKPYDTGQKDSNNCPIKKCIPPAQNQPPTINGVSGPTVLKIRETGAWTVKASDPEQGTLSYSVRWGDEGTTGAYSAAQRAWSYTQSAEFTHSYASAGIYNPTFTVTDDKGLSARTSVSAQVGDVAQPSIHLFGTAPNIAANDTVITVPQGSLVTVSGAPINLNGLSYGTDYTRSFFFDPIFTNVCTNNSATQQDGVAGSPVNEKWLIECRADSIGTGKIYVEIHRNSQTYRSNVITVNIVAAAAPSITVLSPNGGEVWEVGKTYEIKWTSNNLPADAQQKIVLEIQKGSAVVKRYLNNINDGVESYTVPSDIIPSSDYKVNVLYYYTTANAYFDNSNAAFSIVAATTLNLAYDIDGNGKVEQGTDGLLITRFLFGFTENNLTSGAIGAGATRTSASAITSYLTLLQNQGSLDADGNGKNDALSDGTLISRYMAGYTGTSLTNGAVDTGATRTTAAQIVNFLNGVTTAPSTYPLSVSKSGSGSGTVSEHLGGIYCGSTCSNNYNNDATITLTATPASGSTFTGWSGACSGTGVCAITMNAAKSVTATFAATPLTYALSVSKSGAGSGTVSESLGGIYCGSTCSNNYNNGAAITLTATPASGSTFTGWSGACSGTGVCAITMNAAKSVTATFTTTITTTAPVITSVSPTSAKAGDIISVYISSPDTSAYVLFDDTLIPPSSNAGTILTFMLPTYASSGVHNIRVKSMTSGLISNTVSLTIVASSAQTSIDQIAGVLGSMKQVMSYTIDVVVVEAMKKVINQLEEKLNNLKNQ